MQRNCLVSAMVLVCVLQAPDSAAAAECGSPDRNRAGTVKGTLTLDDQASTTRRDFHREESGEERTLQLVFAVAGCELRAPPKVSAGPLKEVDDEIPSEALGAPKVETRSTEVKITYTVRSDSFDPGIYGSLVEVSDEKRVSTARTPITISGS